MSQDEGEGWSCSFRGKQSGLTSLCRGHQRSSHPVSAYEGLVVVTGVPLGCVLVIRLEWAKVRSDGPALGDMACVNFRPPPSSRRCVSCLHFQRGNRMTTWCAPGHKDRMRTQASDSETSRFFLAQTFLEPHWHLPPPNSLRSTFKKGSQRTRPLFSSRAQAPVCPAVGSLVFCTPLSVGAWSQQC